jgi:hypothetical protein
MSKNDEQPKTLSVPEAGKEYFGLGPDGSYRAARRGDFPIIKLGRTYRVPVVALERMLAEAKARRSADDAKRGTAHGPTSLPTTTAKPMECDGDENALARPRVPGAQRRVGGARHHFKGGE